VFPTSTKDSGVIGLPALRDICAATRLPVVSIGGINAANAPSTIHAGCAGVAVVSHIFSAQSPTTAAQQLLEVVDSAMTTRAR
jgi:thiamine-phosphate pyrophosphorylase